MKSPLKYRNRKSWKKRGRENLKRPSQLCGDCPDTLAHPCLPASHGSLRCEWTPLMSGTNPTSVQTSVWS